MRRIFGKLFKAKPDINSSQASFSAKFQQALTFFTCGQFSQAQLLFEEILSIHPEHADTLHLLGLIAAQTNNLPRAKNLIGKAIDIDSHNAAAHLNYGNVLKELKQLDDALASYGQAILLDSMFAEAYYNRGVILQELKQMSAALESYNRAIALKPEHAEAHYNCGNVQLALNQLSAALESYNQAIALKPDYADAYYNRGVLLQELKQIEAALENYDQAIAIKPLNAEAHFKRGSVLHKLKQLNAALASYDNAIALKADHAKAHSNRGAVLYELMQFDAALSSCNQAIALNPDNAEAYAYRGSVLHELKQFDAALSSYDQAIALVPDYAGAIFNKSITLLLCGEFGKGWDLYEWRWKLEGTEYAEHKLIPPQPIWLGRESLAGKTILLHSEQGLGDTIQFCRYAKLVEALGAHVILGVQESLATLLSNLDGVEQLVTKRDKLPYIDFRCPLMSLPLAFDTNIDSIPFSKKYITSDANKVASWKIKLANSSKPLIGLAWSGSNTHAKDNNRSISLAYLIQHLPENYSYISLQKELRDTDKATLESHLGILDFADDIHDFSDTAALCELVDVVISVDTSVAHLAAALGKPTMILLPFVPDWRWLLDRTDSPWYPSVKLYRQKNAGSWDDALEQINSDLMQYFPQTNV